MLGRLGCLIGVWMRGWGIMGMCMGLVRKCIRNRGLGVMGSREVVRVMYERVCGNLWG